MQFLPEPHTGGLVDFVPISPIKMSVLIYGVRGFA